MRAFCLLLVLVNALYFIWSEVIDVQVSSLDRVPIRVAAPPPRIVLAEGSAERAGRATTRSSKQDEQVAEVRDVVPPQVAPLESRRYAAQSASRPAVAREDAMTCSSVGPFADLGQASQAQATLRTMRISAAPAPGAGRAVDGLLGQRA